MKKVLCLGDSLTAGKLGVSWLRTMAAGPDMAASFEMINAGEDGFTMAGLESRLTAYLEREEAPEILILEGGANDLLLPHMQSIGKAWDPFIRKLYRHGSRPADGVSEFQECLERIIRTAEDAGFRKTIVCTIPCLGEDLDSPLNRRREAYNKIIREASPHCADTALYFEAELKPRQPGSSHLFITPEELQEDALIIQSGGEKELCEKRGLHLTIDGAHLNSRGAKIFSKTLETSLSI